MDFYRLSSDFVDSTYTIVFNAGDISLAIGEVDVMPHIHKAVDFTAVVFE